MAKHIQVGKIGEEIAERYLKKKGYTIIRKNYRQTYGEIDIVARSSDRVVVYVEVKTVRMYNDVNKNNITPEDNLTRHKLAKLQRVCRAYIHKHESYVDEKKGWRIDLIAIDLFVEPHIVKRNWWGSIVIPQTSFNVRHYENIY